MARLTPLVAALLIPTLAAPAASAADPGDPWMGAKLRGNEVVAVLSPSPAADAGLEVKDRILSVDGTVTTRGADVARAVSAGQIGQFSVVRVQRGAKQMSLAVFLAARPDRDASTAPVPTDPNAPRPSPTPEPNPFDPGATPTPSAPVSNPFDDPWAGDAPAPAASAPIAPVDLSSYRGDVVVVEFFATWCDACKSTMSTLSGWADRYGSEGLQVVNVSSEDESLLERYREAQSLHTVVATDPDGALARRHGVRVLPTIVVLDRSGKPRGRFIGGGRNLPQIEKLFRELMREGGDRGGITF